MPSVRLAVPSLDRFIPFVQAGAGYFLMNIDDGEIQILTDAVDSEIFVPASVPGEKRSVFGYMASGGVGSNSK